RPLEPRVEARGDIGRPRGRDPISITDRVDELVRRLAAERAAAGEALAGDDAYRPEIRAEIDPPGVGDLLGAHVTQGPEGGARGRLRPFAGAGADLADLDDAEVEDLAHAQLVFVDQEDVGRLEVAVDDAHAVRPADRGADIADDGDRLVRGQGPARDPLG